MNETVLIALFGVLGTLLAALLAPLIAMIANDRNQRRTEQRRLAQERLAILERTYEDVLTSLSNWLRITIQGSLFKENAPEEKSQLITESSRFSARLQLVSTSEIAKQYDETVMQLLNEDAFNILSRATHDESFLPRPPELLVNTIRPHTEAYDSLAQHMQKHLESVRKQAV